MNFDEIYQCALEQNAEKLKKILAPKTQNLHGLFHAPSSFQAQKRPDIDEYLPDRPFVSPRSTVGIRYT